jgi:hypothetical protein
VFRDLQPPGLKTERIGCGNQGCSSATEYKLPSRKN